MRVQGVICLVFFVPEFSLLTIYANDNIVLLGLNCFDETFICII